MNGFHVVDQVLKIAIDKKATANKFFIKKYSSTISCYLSVKSAVKLFVFLTHRVIFSSFNSNSSS